MILLSRLIKSQWSNPIPNEKKVISIKILGTPEKEMIVPTLEEEQKNINKLIEETEAEASRILIQAKKECDLLYEEIKLEREAWSQEKAILKSGAHEEGYKEGKKIGEQQGYSEYQEMLQEARQVVQSARKDYLTYLGTSEKTILDLATKIAKKIIGTKIEENKDYFSALVKRALKEVKDFPEVQLHVHPLHYEELLSKKEELMTIFSNVVNLFIYPDSDLSEDSCLIESSSGRIDASIDTQLSEIKVKLTELLESESV